MLKVRFCELLDLIYPELLVLNIDSDVRDALGNKGMPPHRLWIRSQRSGHEGVSDLA